MDPLKYINKVIDMYEGEEPRITAQEPRIGLQGGQLVQNTDDGSRPGYGGDYTAAEKKGTGKNYSFKKR